MIRYTDNEKVTIYIHYTIAYYCIGYLKHKVMHNRLNKKVILSQYTFTKLEQVKSFKVLLEKLKTEDYNVVYCDLLKGTSLYKAIKKASKVPIKYRSASNKETQLKEFQNLQGVINSDNLEITAKVKEMLEQYSSLIDLEREYFPPEILTLAKMSYFVKG